MKLLRFALFCMLPFFAFAQKNQCDSIYLNTDAAFKKSFAITDTIAKLTSEQLVEYLGQLDDNLACKLFYTAKPLRGEAYHESGVDFGMFEFEFSSLDKARKAFQLLKKKQFQDSWGEFDFLTCSKMSANRIIFIYSSTVRNDKVREFLKVICANYR